jgi:hypothetical protein
VLDADGWNEIAAELNSMLNRVEKIQQASGKRLLKKNHENELRGELVMMLFESADEPAPASGAKRRAAKSAKGGKARA